MFDEIALEIRIALLVDGHRGITEMIKIDVLYPPLDAVGKPSIDESRSCLKRFRFFPGKGD